MTSNRPNKPGSSTGGRRPDDRRPGKGQRPSDRASARDLARAGTRSSGSNDRAAILGWSLAFAVIAIVVVGAAIVLTQPSSGSATLKAPTVVTASSIAATGRTLGVAGAPVTVDLYGDFRCSACLVFTTQGTEQGLVDNYVATGKAKLVWHDRLIIDEIRGGHNSLDAANAAWCAGDQGKFWTLHDWLYANSSEADIAFSAAQLSDMGKKAGLDMSKYQTCLDSGTHAAEITAENASETNAITSTPTIYVNGAYVGSVGAIATYTQLSTAIDAALKAPKASPSPAASPS
jgi:protein-disulfide isomerase